MQAGRDELVGWVINSSPIKSGNREFLHQVTYSSTSECVMLV